MTSPHHTGRRARPVLTIVLGILGVNILAAGVLWAAGLFPSQFSPAASLDADSLLVISAQDTPASRAVKKTMVTTVPDMSGTGSTDVGAGTAQPYPCEFDSPTEPSFGVMKRYSVNDLEVVATASAYPAGTGRWVQDSLTDQLSSCAENNNAVRDPEPVELGTQASSTSIPTGSMMMVRRGDIILRITGPTEWSAKVAASLDAALAAEMDGCVDPGGNPGDERRNPWLADVPYQGLLADSEITIPAVGPPPATLGFAPVPFDAAPVSVPEVSRPSRPSEPIWPASLPTEIAPPVAPISPGPEPTSTTIKIPILDDQGPGCGWSFTGTTAPTIDPASIAERQQALQTTAKNNLLDRQEQWQPAMVAFYQQWADYEQQVAAYQQYASQVATVSAAWAVIESQRATYQRQLAAYEAAVNRREEFLADQATALQEYNDALNTCALQPPPTPTPANPGSPTASPVPTPSPTPTPTIQCPPVRPAILDQQPPAVPPQPTPPPDPRPPEAR